MSLSKAPYSVLVRGLPPCMFCECDCVNVWICDVNGWSWIYEWVNLDARKRACEWVNLNVRKWMGEFVNVRMWTWILDPSVLPACLQTWTGLGGVLKPAVFWGTWWQRSRSNPESWPPGWSETPGDRGHTFTMYREWSVPLLSGRPIYLETLEKNKQRTNVVLHDVNRSFLSLCWSLRLQFMLKDLLLKSASFKTQHIIFGFHWHYIIILSKSLL